MRGIPGVMVATLMAGSAALAADTPPPPKFDCAKAYLPVDHVICASPDLLKVNAELGDVWIALRDRLDEAERQVALDGQRQWIKEYPLACGLPAKGKPPADKIAAAGPCIGKQLRARTAKLRMQLGELPPAAGATVAPPPAPAESGRWQGEANPVSGDGRGARLSITDRQRRGGGYQATFTVAHADGTRWTLHTAAENGVAAVRFPDDFLAPRQPGSYSYEVKVDLEPALKGAFQLR